MFNEIVLIYIKYASTRISLPLRELCRSLGDCASGHIERLLYATKLEARKPLISATSQKSSPSAYIAASSTDLLHMFDADFGLLTIKNEARAIGKLGSYKEAVALLQFIRTKRFTKIIASQKVKEDLPDLMYAPGFSTIAGFMVIPLSIGGGDFMVLFRKGQLKEVHWAGNPNEKIVHPGTSYLEPRASFRRWTEMVEGTSREWTEEQGITVEWYWIVLS